MTSVECGDPALYRSGYDLFFFNRKNIPTDITRPFAMGLPWWDYCLPIALIMRGLQVNLITSPGAFHLSHPTNYNWPHFRYMADEFAAFVLEASGETSPIIVREQLLPVVNLSRKIVAGPSMPERIWDKLLRSTRSLPVLWRLAEKYRGDRYRLSEACVSAILASARPKTLRH